MKFLLFFEKTLTLLFWFLLILGFDTPSVAYMTVIAAAIHECGHLFMSFFFAKGNTSLPHAAISGFRIKSYGLSYKEELFVALGGPVLNFLLGLALIQLPFTPRSAEYFDLFGVINILTCVSNLLPITGFDGYRAVECILAMRIRNSERVAEIMATVSFGFSVLSTFLSLYLILKTGEGYWIFAVFFSALFSVIVKRQKHIFYEKTRDFERF